MRLIGAVWKSKEGAGAQAGTGGNDRDVFDRGVQFRGGRRAGCCKRRRAVRRQEMRHARSGVKLVPTDPAHRADGQRRSVYTDGACKAIPDLAAGAHAVVWRPTKELFGGENPTTNNRMELTAVIEALASLKRRCHVIVHTDSQYVRLGITEWLPGWMQRGWKTAAKRPSRTPICGSVCLTPPPNTRSNGAGYAAIRATLVTSEPMNWRTEAPNRCLHLTSDVKRRRRC